MVKKAPSSVKRTKSIERIIQESSGIIEANLGRTRAQAPVVQPKRGKAVPKVVKEIKKKTPVPPTKKTPIKPTSPVVNKRSSAKKDTSAKKSAPASDKKVVKRKPEETEKHKAKKTPAPAPAPAPVPRKSLRSMEEEIPANKEPRKTNSKLSEVQAKNAPRRTSSKAAAGIVDVVFCCDTTSSMGSYLEQSKQTVRAIVDNIKKKSEEENISVKFGFVCYRDHPPQDNTYVTKLKDLCDEDEILQFIKEQSAAGGGDYPEAVLDGLYVAAKNISWRSTMKVPSLRYIFHIADAPPHGKEFIDNSFWPNGVPSGIDLDKVMHQINIREIHYRLIKIGSNLEKMAALFKEKFTNYDETPLSNATQLNIKVSDMIIRELFNDVDYD